MSDTELFELCKEVYKRFPSWQIENPFFLGVRYYGSPHVTDIQITNDSSSTFIAPLYTSDYILEKLPGRIHSGHYSLDLRLSKVDNEYNFAYMDKHFGFHYEGISDTPLKALLKLVIALKGTLKQEQKGKS